MSLPRPRVFPGQAVERSHSFLSAVEALREKAAGMSSTPKAVRLQWCAWGRQCPPAATPSRPLQRPPAPPQVPADATAALNLGAGLAGVGALLQAAPQLRLANQGLAAAGSTLLVA